MDAAVDIMFSGVKAYVDSRFSEIVKFLPSGRHHEERLAAEVTREIEQLLERYRQAIRRAVKTRQDRLKGSG